MVMNTVNLKFFCISLNGAFNYDFKIWVLFIIGKSRPEGLSKVEGRGKAWVFYLCPSLENY